MKRLALIAALTLGGCTSAPAPQLTTEAVPIYFAGAATENTKPLFPDLWSSVFTGGSMAPAQITKVDEKIDMKSENVGFTGRLRYTVDAALTVNGKIHMLHADADAFAMTGGEKVTRETVARGLASIARQALAIVSIEK